MARGAWRGLSGADVLHIWEVGHDLPSGERALLVLAAAAPDAAFDELARLPLGARDRALLAVRTATLGSRIDAFAQCPACAGALEFPLDTGPLLAGSEAGGRPQTMRTGGYLLNLRPPDCRDEAAAERCVDVASAEAVLLAACVCATGDDGGPVPVEALPDSVRRAAADAILALDPLTDVSFDVTCADCGCGWSLAFDVPAFLWQEIGHHARRLVGEVATLARAYGWSEHDILAMSPARRQSYLAWAG
ncbi:hypothetical protein [Ancylobacter oerskovii]|uniref:Phage baseplate protein n=2 Tax=Ancylobacter oerskovii TaxID=459519 RepID=A0ABW4Z0S7_9HYPH